MSVKLIYHFEICGSVLPLNVGPDQGILPSDKVAIAQKSFWNSILGLDIRV